MRKQVGSGSSWEDVVGYSRAVRVGNIIEIAGTTSGDGENVIGDNMYEQAIIIFKKIEKALQELGSSLNDIVRTRMFVTDISQWEQAGKAHGEFFKNIKPVTTMVEVKALIDPNMLVEIEVTAMVGEAEY